MVASRQRDGTDDAVRARADYGDLVAGLDVDEHVAGHGVVLNVAGVATEPHGADAATARAEHELGAAGLV